MKKWLLLFVLSFNATATCQVDDTGVSNVIVNDMLGFISKKESIMTRVLKKRAIKTTTSMHSIILIQRY